MSGFRVDVENPQCVAEMRSQRARCEAEARLEYQQCLSSNESARTKCEAQNSLEEETCLEIQEEASDRCEELKGSERKAGERVEAAIHRALAENTTRPEPEPLPQDLTDQLKSALTADWLSEVRVIQTCPPLGKSAKLGRLVRCLFYRMIEWNDLSELPAPGSALILVAGTNLYLAPDTELGTAPSEEFVEAVIEVHLQKELGTTAYADVYANSRGELEDQLSYLLDITCREVGCYVAQDQIEQRSDDADSR